MLFLLRVRRLLSIVSKNMALSTYLYKICLFLDRLLTQEHEQILSEMTLSLNQQSYVEKCTSMYMLTVFIS